MSPGCPGHLENITLCPCPPEAGGGGRAEAEEGRGRPCGSERPLCVCCRCTCVGAPWSLPVLLFYLVSFLFLKNPKLFTWECPLGMLQDVRIFSEDGSCKVVEIPTDMTARDLCQLLVYRSHCVDDNSWTLVEHHPHLGLGRSRTREHAPCARRRRRRGRCQTRPRSAPRPCSGRLCLVHHAPAPSLSPKTPSWPPPSPPEPCS